MGLPTSEHWKVSMHSSFNVVTSKGWVAGTVVVIAIAALVYAPKLNKRLVYRTNESKCMRVLEAAAQAARLKGSDEHAQAIFNAMATPECKAYDSQARSQQYRPES